VAVPSNPPPVSVALRELGPTLIWFGLGLLAVGTTLTALFVFRPAHKRLRTLEQAARALGEGHTDVRATEAGGDEVSSLARTFNRMAIDLDSRATALALVFSELLQNALEHGAGTVRIELARRDGNVVLAIADEGAGADGAPSGTGLSIVRALVADELQGSFAFTRARAEVVFPA